MSADETAATTVEAEAPQGEEVQPGAEPAPAADADASENKRATEGVSKRIDELTRIRREAERDRDYWRELAMRTPQAPREEPERREPVASEPELKTLADFGYDERAYGKYTLEIAREAARAEAESLRKEFREGRAQADREQQRQDYESRAEAFAKTEKIEDIDSIFDPSLPITPDMAEVIMGVENGPQLHYYLAKNRAEAAKIARLSPSLQQFQLGLIASKLAKPATKQVSEAPSPAPRVDGGSSASNLSVKADDPDSDKLSDTEWTRLRNKQEAARRARRFAKV